MPGFYRRRTYGSYSRGYGRKSSKSKFYLNKAVSLAKSANRNSKEDIGYIRLYASQDGVKIGADYINTANCLTLTGVQNHNRTGLDCVVTGFKFSIDLSSAIAACQTVRVMVVRYIPVYAATPAISNILDTPGGSVSDYTMSSYNTERRGLYKFYYDKLFNIQGTDAARGTDMRLLIKKKCHFKMQYAGNAASITNLVKNVLMLIISTDADDESDGLNVKLYSKVYFTR